MKWRVWSIDEKTGTVELMSENVAPQALNLNGYNGYINSKTVLNNISSVYGSGDGAIGARSFNETDLEKYSTFDKTKYPAYGDETTYTSGDFVVEQNGIYTKVTATEQNPVTMTCTDYDYDANDYITNSTVFEMLFRKTLPSGEYGIYIDSRYTYLKNEYASQGIIQLRYDAQYKDKIWGISCFRSNQGSAINPHGCVLPIVTLQTNLQTTGKDENGAWNLKLDETVPESEYAYTLAQAVEKAPEGASTIKALVGITETTEVTVPENKSILLDLNGKTTTFNGVSIINNGTLDIYSSEENGILYSSSSSSIHNKGIFTTNRTSNQNEISIINTSTEDYVELIRNDSTATLNDKTTLKLQNAANNSSSTQNRYVVINRGTTTIDGATLINKAGETVYEHGISNASTPLGGKIIVKSGSIETAGCAIMNIGGTGNSTSDPAIKITGGTITSTGASAIYNEREDSMLYIAKEDDATPPTIYTTSKTSVSTINSKGSFTMETGEIIGYSGMAVLLSGSNSTALVSGGTITKAQNPDNTVGNVGAGWFGGACFQYEGTKTATITGDAVIQNESGNGSNVIYNNGTGTMEIGGNAKVRNLGAVQVGGNFRAGKVIVKDNAEITSNGGNVLVNGKTSSTSYTETLYPRIEITGNAKLSTSGNRVINNTCAYGQIIVTGGTLTAEGTSGSSGTIHNAAEHVSINISGGTIDKPNAAYAIWNDATGNNSSINITGGSVTSGGYYSIYADGVDTNVTVGTEGETDNTTPSILGGILGNSADISAITINSGTITGTTGNAIRNYGETVINGGNLSTNGIYGGGNYPYTVIGFGNASNITMNGGQISNNQLSALVLKYDSTATIEMNGGTVTTTSEYGIAANNGNVIIKGGKVESGGTYGINAMNLTIKNNTNSVSTESPIIIGNKYGVGVMGTFNFYGGVIIGKNGSGSSINYSGTIGKPEDYEIIKVTKNESECAYLARKFVTDGIVGRYDGLNNTGSGHSDTAIWKDLSSNNNDGTITNKNWGDNYLEVDQSTWVNLGRMDYNNVTLEATIEIDDTFTTAGYFIANVESGGYGIRVNSDRSVFAIYHIGGGYQMAQSSQKLEFGKTYNIAMSYDNAKLILYINGVVASEKTVTGAVKQTTGNTVMALGGNPTVSSMATGEKFVGKIYGAAVYNKVLEATQVAQNANAALARAELIPDVAKTEFLSELDTANFNLLYENELTSNTESTISNGDSLNDIIEEDPANTSLSLQIDIESTMLQSDNIVSTEQSTTQLKETQVVQIDQTMSSAISEAIEDSNSGDSVKGLDNISLVEENTIEGGENIPLDFNGKFEEEEGNENSFVSK